MTTEEKARAYDEALAIAKECITDIPDDAVNKYMLNMFPELAESEDERIRKELIGFIENWKNPNNLGRPQDYPMFTKNEEQCNKYITWLEKQGEQKPVDKVEPKFKVGDWITFTRKDGTRETLQVSDIIDGRYYFNHLIHGSWSVKECNEKCHLWTIEDAKDGDVLAMGDVICIFKKMDTAGLSVFWTHCEIIGNSELGLGFSFSSNTIINPATKEQRDLLFQKIQEFGYKWENNQLEKIDNEDFVDLGLPSGTLWAKCNLGAEKETDFGLFYQWGDTKGYKGVDEHQFDWNDYKFGRWYNVNENDKKLILDNEYDPVLIATNGVQITPTMEQLQELIDNTDHEWANIDGVNGMKFTNKSDDTKYIFIPAAGYCYAGNYVGRGCWGSVWSASRNESIASRAWRMYFDAGGAYVGNYGRCYGYSMRGVVNIKK